MDKTCFAYSTRFKDCNALHDNKGCGLDCPFRKSPAEFEAARLRAEQRLAGLPKEQRQYIADTYYVGERPWWLAGARKAVGG